MKSEKKMEKVIEENIVKRLIRKAEKEKKYRKLALSFLSFTIVGLYWGLGYPFLNYYMNIMFKRGYYSELFFSPIISILLIIFGLISLMQARFNVPKRILGIVSVLIGSTLVAILIILFNTSRIMVLHTTISAPMFVFSICLICIGLDLLSSKELFSSTLKDFLLLLAPSVLILNLLLTLPLYGALSLS